MKKHWKKITAGLLVVAIFFLFNPLKTYASFSFVRSITIDHTKVPNTDQTDFPVLFSGTYSYLATVANGGKVQNASGFDIGFYSSSDCASGKLNWEIEAYDAASGTTLDWIKIANVSHTVDTVFYVCYGDASITTNQSNKTAVWDANFQGVWHAPDGTTLSLLDSTSNGYNGTNTGLTAIGVKIDGGIASDATRNFADVTGANLIINGALTVEFWFSSDTVASPKVPIYSVDSVDTTKNAWGVLLNGTTNGKIGFDWTDGTRVLSATTFVVSTLHHVVFTRAGSSGNWTGKIYVDGNIDNTVTGITTNPSGTAGNKTYLADYVQDFGLSWNGELDEFRVSNSTRGPDWVSTEYANENSPSTFYTVGNEASPSTGPFHKTVFASNFKFVLTGNHKFIFN